MARGLAERGHQVTVLTSQYERDLPEHEVDDAGVAIVRVPVWRRVNKGVVMPRLGRTAERLIREHDVVNAHLPQFDSPGLALRSRRHRTPVVLTYHCDVKLAPSPFNAVANAAVNAANHLGARWCDAIVTYTQDYADHSPYPVS